MRHARGFTLIEMIVTLAVLAIAVAIAIPSFTTQIRNNQSRALGEEFGAALSFARSEAVKRGQLVSICASDAAQTNCANDWTNGWLVFVDGAALPGATAPVINAPATDILRIWEPAGDQAVMTVTNDGASRDFIRFTNLGTLARLTDEHIIANTRITDCSGEAAHVINVSLSGSVHSRRTACP